MRHRQKSKRINRDRAHLDAMLRNLATSVILYEKIKTTQAKAKLVKPIVEKLITASKGKSKMNAYRTLNAYLFDTNASKKLMNELAPRYKDKSSGCVRITKLGFRAGDAAPVVQLELV